MAKKRSAKAVVSSCCNGKFPTFPTILIVIGVLWLLNELKILPFELPWLPIVIIIIGLGMYINSSDKK